MGKRGPKPKGPLDSMHRVRMLDIVRKTPGITTGELAGRFPFQSGSLYHHLRILADAGFLRMDSDPLDRRLTHLYPAGPGAGAAGRRGSGDEATLSAEARELALIIIVNPGLDARELARLSASHIRVVYYHLKRFTRDALVTSASPGRYVGLRAAPSLYRVAGLPEPGKPRDK